MAHTTIGVIIHNNVVYGKGVVKTQIGLPYTHYRLYVTRATRDGSDVQYCSVSELKMFTKDGENVTKRGGMTPICSAFGGSSYAQNAFDDNLNSIWHSPSGGSAVPLPQWIGFSLPESVVVTSVAIGNRRDYADLCVDFEIQGSNDGVDWTTIKAFINVTDGWDRDNPQVFQLYD